MPKELSEDLHVQIVKQNETHVLAIIVQDGFRENRSINLVGEEVKQLYFYLKEELEDS